MLPWPACRLEHGVSKGVCRAAASELPLKRSRGRFVMLLEAEETILKLGEGTEVVRGEHLALDNEEIDLDLVHTPAGFLTPYDRFSRSPGRSGRAGDAGTSSSVRDAPGEREKRPGGRASELPGRRCAALVMDWHHGAPRALARKLGMSVVWGQESRRGVLVEPAGEYRLRL